MDNLTNEQFVTVRKLKENVKDIEKPEYDDRFYARWLIARDFDLPKAEKMLRDSILWRKRYDIENIGTWETPQILRHYYPGGFCGEARDGTPVFYFRAGHMDIKSIYYNVNIKDTMKYVCKLFEHLDKVLTPRQSEKHGQLIDQATVVYDFEGFDRKMLWKPMLERNVYITQQFDLNYPERLKRSLLINVPIIFSILWNFGKHVLSNATKKKIILLGGNWRDEIQTYIDPDELPMYWGGNAPDPPAIRQSEFDVCWGGPVPDKYKNQKPDIDLSRFATETVKRGKTLQLEVKVNVKDTVLEWQFLTEDHAISFGVFRKTDDKHGDMEEVYKAAKCSSHLFPEDGSITCEHPGTYVLLFDNTYRWASTKTLHYTIDVLEPGTTEDIDATKE